MAKNGQSTATLGDSLSLIAKTSNDRGPRSLSAFWLDKRHMVSKGTYSLNRLPTVGMRGLDISGIGFNNAEIHKDALIGEEGRVGTWTQNPTGNACILQ